MKNYKKNSILIFLLTIFLPTASQAFASDPALAKQKVLLQQYQEQIKLREAIRNNNGQNKDVRVVIIIEKVAAPKRIPAGRSVKNQLPPVRALNNVNKSVIPT